MGRTIYIDIDLRCNNMNLALKLKEFTNHVSKYTLRPMDFFGVVFNIQLFR